MSRPRALVLLAALAGSSCAGPRVAAPSPATALCAVGDTALVRDLVYFGRNRPDGGTVSDAEWLEFLDSVVTPSFPSGFTVVEGTGQWKGQSGAVERERSAIITFLHTGSVADRNRVAQVAGAYKRRFHQEAVLRERIPACARFE
ncbi:MAG TPA: DUF3574 domain-containing protein [Gemmatimonadales bacterium]|nr:DUF3574 domain-containing protein [Gemmatimonadales bacterium]